MWKIFSRTRYTRLHFAFYEIIFIAVRGCVAAAIVHAIRTRRTALHCSALF